MESEGAKQRVLMGLVLGITLAVGWGSVTAGEPPPTPLTPEERKVLETKWNELVSAGDKYCQAGKLAEATESLRKALEVARRLYPKQDHLDLADSLNNLAIVSKPKGSMRRPSRS
jgi:hypothetical protein